LVYATLAGVGILTAAVLQPAEAKAVEIKKPNLSYSSEFKRELSMFLLPEQIELDTEERKQRGKPWNSYHKSNYYPEMILYPQSTEQVSKIVKLCNKYNVPLVPFGGGTSLEGQTIITPTGGVSLDFNRMKRIVELNEDDLDVRVEAGLGYVELNEILKSKGLWFPLDPGPGASIGGELL
jgi:D-lactate dehydrogenase (cytochrome)